ncbi:unnamed protein product, partial [Polarella glacialis]
VISSPFGFGATYEGMVLLFALDLRNAEGLSSSSGWMPCDCGASAARLKGRVVVAELALGRCHTVRYSLQEALPSALQADGKCLGGGVPMVPALEAEYRAGADSVYFPKAGVIALLCPKRALPLFLAEYRRQRLGPGELGQTES